MLSRLRGLIKAKSVSTDSKTSATDDWDHLYQQAQSLQRAGELVRAIELYDLLIARRHDRSEPFYKRANALNSLGRLQDAVGDYDRAIALQPNYAHAYCNRGSVLDRLGLKEEALLSCERAIELEPSDALSHYNRASVLKELERYDEALASYEKAIGLDERFAEARVNHGGVLYKLGRYGPSVDSFTRAIALNPTIAQAFMGRGVSLQSQNRLQEALADYNKAISLEPAFADAFLNRGGLLMSIDRFEESVKDYLKAIEIVPKADTYRALAQPLVRLKRFDKAIASMDKAAEIDPKNKFVLGESRSTRMHAARWDGLEADLKRLVDGVFEGHMVCHPFSLAALVDSPALTRAAAKLWTDRSITAADRDSARISPPVGPADRIAETPKIKLGYFSTDFREHPVAYLSAGLFEHHDRSRFDVIGFALGPESNDAMASRLAAAFDRLIDVRWKSDAEVVALARELGIDIAVDLNGYTEHSRSEIFAMRAAPIQVNFLGYPGTMGGDFMDYLIADGVVVPQAQQRHYAEKIAYLPGSFLPFDSSYAIAERVFGREEQGLPSEGFVFCCFNGSYKILPETFDRWMRILSRSEGSVLWLPAADAMVMGNLRLEAQRRGIDPERLVFAQRMQSLPEHLARLRLADLFLDTFPYNAHSTALDALWAGVPLLTYAGESFASRVAASLLHAVELPELIAASPEEYIELAVALAHDPARLGALRQKLTRRETTLFDTGEYTRKLEAVYEAMYQRRRSGAAPAHLNAHLAL